MARRELERDLSFDDAVLGLGHWGRCSRCPWGVVGGGAISWTAGRVVRGASSGYMCYILGSVRCLGP